MNIPPRSTASHSVAMAQETARGAAKAALEACGFRVVEQSATDRIKASSGMGIASWGEDITLTLTSQDGRTLIEIESRSKMPLALVDWGKNKRNVERVVEQLVAAEATR